MNEPAPDSSWATFDDVGVWPFRGLKVYIDWRDWWMGYYRGDTHHYVCPLFCLVIRWERKRVAA